MIGLRDYAPANFVWPYAFFGLGGVTYDLEKPLLPTLRTLVRERGTAGDQQSLVVVDRTSEFLLSIDEVDLESTPAFSLGIGTDLRLPVGGGGFGFRIEAVDNIGRSPIQLRLAELGRRSPFDTSERLVGVGWVHNLRFAAGLVVHFGLR